MMVKSIAWCLPRPRRKDKYPGGFPQHFERRLLELIGCRSNGVKILHPFGGMAEYGIRLDILPGVQPDIIGDAHNLPIRDSCIDVVILDPPYSDEESSKIYGTGHLDYKRYVSESLRVLKPSGFLALFHKYSLPLKLDAKLIVRILIEIRAFRTARICKIYQKNGSSSQGQLFPFRLLGGLYEQGNQVK